MEEQLSGACTTEIAAFDEFTALLTDERPQRATTTTSSSTPRRPATPLRLLQLPSAWTDFLEANKGDTSCLGPLSGLEKQRNAYRRRWMLWPRSRPTPMVLVTRPHKARLDEAARTSTELGRSG